MKNKIILIVDGLSERRDAMLKAFIGLSGITLYRLNFKDGKVTLQLFEELLGFWENQGHLPLEVDLMLIHGRDDSYKDFVSTKKRIWYGGYTGQDPRAPEGEESITRPIEKVQEAISKNEAEEFIAYLNGGSQPACLNPDGFNELTEQVLSILKLLLNPDARDCEKIFLKKYNQLKRYTKGEIDHVKDKTLALLRSKGISQEERLNMVLKIREDLLQSAL